LAELITGYIWRRPVATNQQRRNAEREVLRRQLDKLRTHQARRRRTILIGSVTASVIVIAAIVVAIVVVLGGGNNVVAGGHHGNTHEHRAATKCTSGFFGVSVANKTNLHSPPKVSSKGCETPKKVQYKDLVTGKGKAASPSSTVKVQYTGVLYNDGKQFDSSWKNGKAASFPLARVVKGFKQGIGGGGGVQPMHVGGRRIIIIPGALGYPQGQPQAGIPAKAPLVFVVDLLAVQ
jgi:peptidylprolyl isomerase